MAVQAAIGLVLLAVLLGFAFFAERAKREQFVIPDEKAAAAARLSQTFKGPGYFVVQPAEVMDSAGVSVASHNATPEPHLSATSAHSQVDRITQERSLGPQTSEKIHALIDRLTEEPKSRSVGKAHVNLLRLNLSLDSL